MRTSQLAAQAGVNAQTLRYYERRGLLPCPRRTDSGYREYPAEAVRLIRFIKRSQNLGFTLGEIEDLLKLRQSAGTTRARMRAVAQAKIGDIETKIRELGRIRDALELLVTDCCSSGRATCPIIDALDDAGPTRALHQIEPARRTRALESRRNTA